MDLRPNPSPDENAKHDDSTGVSSADWANRLSDRSAGSVRALLAEFARTGDERTFEEVVRRYAGMVHAVCVRITKDAHDAEDATQAVFLALAMHVKTRPEQPIKYLGPWLQQVARRLSLDIRRSKGRRKKREAKLGELERQRLGVGFLSDDRHSRSAALTDALAGPIDQLDQEDLRQLISAELDKLPAKYRLPLILHYFGGMSREEMSKELGVKPNTLGVRVFRGRELLGKRLAGRGIVLSGAVLMVVLEEVVRASVSDAWITATSHAAAGAVATMSPSAVASVQVVAVLRAVSRGMMLAKLKLIGIGVLLLATVTAGGAEVATRIAKRLNLKPTWNWNVGDQVRQLLRSITQPTLTSDATEFDEVVDEPLARAKHNGWNGSGAQRLPVTIVQSSEYSLVTSNTYAGWPALPEMTFAPLWVPAETLNKPNISPASDTVASARPAGIYRSAPQKSAAPPVASSPTIVLGASRGSNQSRTLGPREALHSSAMVVGNYGQGTFKQSGAGSFHHIDDDLMLGRYEGASGRYELTGPGARLEVAGNEIVGGEGFGEFIHSDGANIVGGSLIVGQRGHGRYEQADGVAIADGGLVVAQFPGSTGAYQLFDGALVADPQLIGKGGVGTLSQSGGTNTAKTVWVAAEHGSSGTYSLPRGVLELDALANVTNGDVYSSKPGHAGINVGGSGSGSFRLGAINKKAKIIEKQAGSYLAVRAKEAGSGTFRGWGSVGITGQVINNGQIIADGYGATHALDLSSASEVINTIQNLPVAGSNGWFARNGGELVLPPIKLAEGSAHYSWGESADDALPDLVNSVRLHVDGAQTAGDLRVSLLALDRAGQDVPAFPLGHHFIGVWSYDSDVITTGIDLAVRYDDALAETMGLNEHVLKLWRFDPAGDQWIRINDDSFRRYPSLNIVSGHASEAFTYFAVSAPEPIVLAPLALGGWMLLRRRRR